MSSPTVDDLKKPPAVAAVDKDSPEAGAGVGTAPGETARGSPGRKRRSPTQHVEDDEEEGEGSGDEDTGGASQQQAKLQARREANRVHALRSRQRSKQLLTELQKTVQTLSGEKSDLERQNAILRAQVEVLQQQNRALLQSQQQTFALPIAAAEPAAALSAPVVGSPALPTAVRSDVHPSSPPAASAPAASPFSDSAALAAGGDQTAAAAMMAAAVAAAGWQQQHPYQQMQQGQLADSTAAALAAMQQAQHLQQFAAQAQALAPSTDALPSQADLASTMASILQRQQAMNALQQPQATAAAPPQQHALDFQAQLRRMAAQQQQASAGLAASATPGPTTLEQIMAASRLAGAPPPGANPPGGPGPSSS